MFWMKIEDYISVSKEIHNYVRKTGYFSDVKLSEDQRADF